MYHVPRLVAVPDVQRHQSLFVGESGGPGEGMASVLNVLLHKGLRSENVPHELRAPPPRLCCSVTPFVLQSHHHACVAVLHTHMHMHLHKQTNTFTYTRKQARIPGSATTRLPGDGVPREQTADTEGC